MKIGIRKFISLGLFVSILLTSPQFLLAQTPRLVGELNITATGNGFVTVNGERAVDGRSITSPSEIVTSAEARAKISLAQTGTVLIEPNSKLNLSFVNAAISGEFTSGEVTIETAPNTSVNILTADGALTVPNRSQANIIKISRDGSGRTRVNTLSGQAMFNNVLISAGEFYPQTDATPTPTNTPAGSGGSGTGSSNNSILLIALLGAAAGAAVLALAVSSGGGGNDSPPTLSPVR
jgi:hypothetical protein